MFNKYWSATRCTIEQNRDGKIMITLSIVTVIKMSIIFHFFHLLDSAGRAPEHMNETRMKNEIISMKTIEFQLKKKYNINKSENGEKKQWEI